MDDAVVTIQQWVSTDMLIGMTIASIVGFVGSLIPIPWILIRLPSDYFDIRVPRYWMKDRHPVLRIIGVMVKNVIGVVFLLAGFLMLFLPGQGLLSMLVGISLMDFPNKRKLEARIVGQHAVFNAINKMRHKFNQLPFTLKPHTEE